MFLLVFNTFLCSLHPSAKLLSRCPTYALLQSGHVSLYAPDLVYLSRVWGFNISSFWRVVCIHCDSKVSFPEKVCNESGLSANVCEGGPFLCGLVCFLVEGRGGMSWGGGFVRVDQKPIVQHDIMDSVKFFVFIISQVVCVQPIV